MFRLPFEGRLAQVCLRWALLPFEVSHNICCVRLGTGTVLWPKVTQP